MSRDEERERGPERGVVMTEDSKKGAKGKKEGESSKEGERGEGTRSVRRGR